MHSFLFGTAWRCVPNLLPRKGEHFLCPSPAGRSTILNALRVALRIISGKQLGRAIYALDEDNPVSDDKRPVVIDLANNSLTVNIEKDFKNIETIDDLESLIIVTEWIEMHGGILPSSTSSNKQEQHYYAILRRVQNKYNKYLNGFENFEELNENEKEQIQEIIEIGTSMDLWNIELPPKIGRAHV